MIRAYPDRSSAVACIFHQCMRIGEKCRLSETNQVSQLSTYIPDRAKFGNYLPGLSDAEPSADVLRADFLTGNDIDFKTIEKFLLLLVSACLEDLGVELANDEKSGPASE